MNKTKPVIKIIIWAIVVFAILVFGVRVTRKHLRKADSQPVVLVGIPKNQLGGLKKELDYASNQMRYLEKGDRLIEENKMDEAIKQYENAFSLAKSRGSRAVAHIAIANAYEKKRDYKKTLELVVIDRDKYVNDWAKEPVVERVKYLEYALNGEYELSIKHAQKALEADAKLPNTPKGGSPDYIERLNDLKAAKDYILSLKTNKADNPATPPKE
ncbi:MAG: hypothetical protein HQ593_00035 [Candidatus Omnitrophica bacterium]|nr:hypothetical protein [Candidatus Omnitrophota bacterium]